MSATVVIARQHVRSLSRSRTFTLILGVLLLMTAVSGLIGWSSHATIIRVYDNMIIYIPLIGALMAIVIGHTSVTADRQAGVTRVIFSRPVKRSSYFWGKLSGSAFAGAVIMAACLVLSVASLTLINGGLPTASELLRLTLFYALSGLYLLLFVLIGMVAALLTGSQSMALFAAVAVWVLVTFATPQFTSGLRPVASLNPVTDPATVSRSAFFKATSKAKPIAVNEQYKELSTRILTEGSSPRPAKTAAQLAPIALFLVLVGGWANLLLRRRDFSDETARD
jgi:ABC-type transport system involved in multi-copper enzyme maturation permease subunit